MSHEFNSLLFGNEKSIQQLVKHYNMRSVPHSLIFYGPKGIGKASLAINFSTQLINNQSSIDENDLRRQVSQSPDYRNIYHCKREYDETTKKLKSVISIDQIRNLKEFFFLSQTEQNWRIAVIDSMDEMNEASANAILKLLEEPPIKSLIILVSHSINKVKPTILSRCQKISFQALTEKQTKGFMDQYKCDDNEKDFVLSLAEGLPGKALNLLNTKNFVTYEELVQTVSKFSKSRNKTTEGKGVSFTVNKSEGSTISINEMILMLIERVTRSIIGDKSIKHTNSEKKLLEQLSEKSELAIDFAELYLHLEEIISQSEKVNIEQSEITWNCMDKIKKLFEEKV